MPRAEDAGGLPGFVVDEVEGYLRCGILEHGVAHLACRRCGHAMVVAFSCKGRGFCPSCTGRRMADLAAHLVDEVPFGQRCDSSLRLNGNASTNAVAVPLAARPAACWPEAAGRGLLAAC